MISKIKILQSGSGQYWFRVVANNGAILCHSEEYRNYTDCLNAARIVQRGGGTIE